LRDQIRRSRQSTSAIEWAAIARLIAAGGCFTIAAVLITIGFAWSYVRLGATPSAAWAAVLNQARRACNRYWRDILSLGRATARHRIAAIRAVAAAALTFAGATEMLGKPWSQARAPALFCFSFSSSAAGTCCSLSSAADS